MKAIGVTLLLIPLITPAAELWPEISCGPSPSPLFQSSEPLEISMKGTFPVRELQNAEILVLDAVKNQQKSIPISVEARGKSRGNNCEFKPIRVVWGEKQQELRAGSVFEGTKGQDMKLTVHCSYTSGGIADHPAENEVIIKEYMVYKMLKTFGLPAFDVRLTKVQYKDAEGKPMVEGIGFFIESSAQLANRCGLKHVKRDEVLGAVGPSMNKQIYLPYLFSRLITDARDFIVQYDGGHNSEPFTDAAQVTQAIVPYDFNDSGQVNSGIAPYWSFSPNYDYWFNLLRQGPFTRDSSITSLDPTEMKLWRSGAIEMAKRLIAKRNAVHDAIDESPMLKESKNGFHAHVDMLVGQFQKIVDDEANPVDGLPAPLN